MRFAGFRGLDAVNALTVLQERPLGHPLLRSLHQAGHAACGDAEAGLRIAVVCSAAFMR